jgi:hypothetical protein
MASGGKDAHVAAALARDRNARARSCSSSGRRRCPRPSCSRSCSRPARPGHSALDVARRLLSEFRSLRGLLTAERHALCRVRGLGDAKYALLQASLELSRRHYAELMQMGPALANPRATREFLRARLRDRDHEVFCCLFLDNRHRVICFDEVFRGTIDGASVHPRDVVKLALARKRRGGDPRPQPPLRGRRAEPGRRAHHRAAARRAGARGHPRARPHRGGRRGVRLLRRTWVAVGGVRG